ncbi:MAG: AI-2E family transporter [Candidatus Moranbacteria bacterium]|nr:AI-2E family transporter [Candidatus Moranbacteria bacterium]
MSDERVAIGTNIAVRLALVVLAAYFLYFVRDVVLVVLFAILTAAALSPAINKLREWHLSRAAAVIIVYAVLFLGGVALLVILLPLFFSEVKEFLENWPEYVKRLDSFLSNLQVYLSTLGIDFQKDQFFQDIEGNVAGWLSHIFSTTLGLFQSFIHLIGFFFLALYLSLEERGIEKFFLLLTPKEYHTQAFSIASRMQGKVSQWLVGQALLMLIAFVMYYIGLTVLHVPYALAIAFFGGIMEILPYIGPVIAAIPAIMIGFLVSPVLGASALIFYIIAHQVEAHIIAPQVMKHSAGLNPVALIIAILIGAELAGPLGIILSVPITMMLSVFVDDILEKRQE